MKKIDWGKALIGLMAIIFIAGRSINLNWGTPYFFHPDERNVASAVDKIHQNRETNKSGLIRFESDFYAYGGVPIYTVYYLSEWSNYFIDRSFFEIAIIWGRVISITWSLIVIGLMVLIAKELNPGKWLWYVFILSATSFGWIQFSRYGTFEMWLTGLGLLILWSCLRIWKHNKLRDWMLGGIFLGLAIGTKIPSIVMLGIPTLSGLSFIGSSSGIGRLKMWTSLIGRNLLLLMIAVLIVFWTNPMMLNHEDYQIESLGKLYANSLINLPEAIHDSINNMIEEVKNNDVGITETMNIRTMAPLIRILNPDFVHSMNVEGAIAKGSLKVFYTRHFNGTTPVLYQLTRIVPWLISWPMMLAGIMGVGLMIFGGIYKKNFGLILVLAWWMLQAIFVFSLFVKWTRYMVPLMPIFIWGAAWYWNWIEELFMNYKNRVVSYLIKSVYWFSWIWHIVFSLMLFITITQTDTRIEAANWVEENKIDRKWRVLSEVYDLGIVPMNSKFDKIDLFNFYDLDDQEDSQILEMELEEKFERYEVFIITSRRLWYHTIQNPDLYPKASEFYRKLLSGQTEFVKYKEFTNYPRLGPLKIMDEIRAEETFSVFDRPRVQIFVRKDLVHQITNVQIN